MLDHGTLSDDNARHELDDYYEGYNAGLSYALQAMVEHGFILPPLGGEMAPETTGGK